MEELEKRANIENFLDKLIKEWKRLFSCQSTGVGNYCFDRGRWMKLKKVKALIDTLKEEKIQMAKDHRRNIDRIQFLLSRMGKKYPEDLKEAQDVYKARQRK